MNFLKQTRHQFMMAALILLSILTACTDDEAAPCQTTYESEVKAIVLKSCAYSGCHSGTDASPYVPASAKDYTNYEGMMQTLENGKFEERALVLQNMPPSGFIPQGKPTSLALDEIETLKCWLENGFLDR